MPEDEYELDIATDDLIAGVPGAEKRYRDAIRKNARQEIEETKRAWHSIYQDGVRQAGRPDMSAEVPDDFEKILNGDD